MDKLHNPYNKFKGAIRERGVTYDDLGELLGVTKSTICNKINGRSDFYISETNAIDKAYGIGTNFFA